MRRVRAGTSPVLGGGSAPFRAPARLPRRLAQLGGTTTFGDCLVALAHLVRPATLVDGPAVQRYERAFAERIGSSHAVSLAAARVGLYGLLRALGVGPGDEVLVPLPSHVVVPNAVRYVGATPVFVDCRTEDVNLDVTAAARAITPRTKVLLVQHTFGMPADLDAAVALAERHGLVLLEDCVHALGATYGGRPVGTFGRAGFFSTEETKIISSTMGGVVVTDDHDLAERLRDFQQRCAPPAAGLVAGYLLKYIAYWLLTQPTVHVAARALYEAVGRRHPLPKPTSADELRGDRPKRYETRFSNAQAALALRQLARLDANLTHRRWAAASYGRALERRGLATPRPVPRSEPSWVRYPVWVRDRDAATRRVERHTVVGHWFSSVLEEADDPATVGYAPGSCRNAEAAGRYLVNLPTHPRVDEHDVAAMVAALAPEALAAGSSSDRGSTTPPVEPPSGWEHGGR